MSLIVLLEPLLDIIDGPCEREGFMPADDAVHVSSHRDISIAIASRLRMRVALAPKYKPQLLCTIARCVGTLAPTHSGHTTLLIQHVDITLDL